jgi:hypothetical protein
MDFNDMQNAWNTENTDKVVVPANLEKIQSANTPLDKIKQNLKMELITQVLAVIGIGFVPLLYDFPKTLFSPFYLLYAIFAAVCIYYLAKLFLFYKRLNTVSLSTKDSLYETYFDIRLNMELYKTFGFALTPFLVVFLIGLFYQKLGDKVAIDILNLTNSQIIGAVVALIISILLMGLVLEVWVHFFYGRYAKEIRKLIDELKEY